MKKLIFAIAVAMVGVARGQGIPVFDASSTAQMVLSVRALGDQLRQLQSTYDAVSGSRGLGSILYNPTLRQYLPADWQKVYDSAAAGGYSGISGTLNQILASERLTGTAAQQQAAIEERNRKSRATDKAVGMRAFEGAQQRLAQIEQLMTQINGTQDPKAIQELHARIGIEQAAVQNETTKLQLVSMLQRAEERLIEQQKTDAAQKILSSANRGMPACCSSTFTGR